MAPQKCETPLAGGEFAKENTECEAIVGQTFADHKAFANLRARFAILGHELHVIRKGDVSYFEVRRWGQSRTCSTLHDLQGFLAMLGGRP